MGTIHPNCCSCGRTLRLLAARHPHHRWLCAGTGIRRTAGMCLVRSGLGLTQAGDHSWCENFQEYGAPDMQQPSAAEVHLVTVGGNPVRVAGPPREVGRRREVGSVQMLGPRP